MSGAVIIAGFALRESLRKRVFIVVAILTVAFLALYGLGVWQIAKEADELGGTDGVEGEVVAGATLLGLSMFATLFLGAILAVFLTLGAVRGDAERGLLQPLLVRPLSRATFLVGRYVAAAGVCVIYVMFVFLASVVITGVLVDWWPDRVVVPALELGVGVAIIAALALGGSVVLSSTANGIAIFMLFGAGLTAGLLGQIAEALSSDTLEEVSRVAAWVLPFEALYQSALNSITADTFGFTRFAIDLGPFGGAQTFGGLLWPYVLLYTGAVGAAALWAFRRRDL
jgi:ABC-type transport system involved in multi-copper enzyme maturation permease subunit